MRSDAQRERQGDDVSLEAAQRSGAVQLFVQLAQRTRSSFAWTLAAIMLALWPVTIVTAVSNGQIAARLQLTEATVKRHLRNIFVKLGAVSRLDAVNKAKEWQQQADGGPGRASGGPGRPKGR